MNAVKRAAVIIFAAALLIPQLAQSEVVQVQLVGISFTPDPVMVKEGDTVQWINTAQITHTTTSGTACTPDGLWNSGFLGLNDTFSHVFSTTGSFPYYCIPHCGVGMTGTVIVDPDPTGIDDDLKLQHHSMSQNYPNPFNPVTTIDYSVSAEAQVNIDVFNSKGQLVRNVADAVRGAGRYTAQWDGRNNLGIAQASGIYFYQLRLDGVRVDMKKMVLLK